MKNIYRVLAIMVLTVVSSACDKQSDSAGSKTVGKTIEGASEELRAEEVRRTIKAVAKDPDSARFDRVLVSEDGDIGCAIWNAKNSFGGYGDGKITEVRKRNGRWEV